MEDGRVSSPAGEEALRSLENGVICSEKNRPTDVGAPAIQDRSLTNLPLDLIAITVGLQSCFTKVRRHNCNTALTVSGSPIIF